MAIVKANAMVLAAASQNVRAVRLLLSEDEKDITLRKHEKG